MFSSGIRVFNQILHNPVILWNKMETEGQIMIRIEQFVANLGIICRFL